MKTSSLTRTLLALMLALKNLKAPLGAPTIAQLFEVGEQLQLRPDDWEFIQEGLMATIDDNPDLRQPFQAALTQLDAADRTILPQLLPTEQELTEILSKNGELERRGVGSEESDFESKEIINITIGVLKDDNPPARVQKSSWLDRIVKLLT